MPCETSRAKAWRELPTSRYACFLAFALIELHEVGPGDEMMTQVVQAIYENGVLRPLERLDLGEHQQVEIVIQAGSAAERGGDAERSDPLEGIRCDTGISDLAEHFDGYRLGQRKWSPRSSIPPVWLP